MDLCENSMVNGRPVNKTIQLFFEVYRTIQLSEGDPSGSNERASTAERERAGTIDTHVGASFPGA